MTTTGPTYQRITYTQRYFPNGKTIHPPTKRNQIATLHKHGKYSRRCVVCGTEIDTNTPYFASDVRRVHVFCVDTTEPHEVKHRA